jgi:hypothetical protein
MIQKRTLLLLFVWALIILTAFSIRFWLSYKPSALQHAWHAARQLPEDHQLRPDDLEKPNAETDASSLPPLNTLVGYHLVAAKNAGDVVEPKSITPLPALGPVGEDESYVLYTLNEEELATADLLKRGDYVQPCSVQPPSDQPRAAKAQRNGAVMCSGVWLEVAAVHRKSGLAPLDWIVLKVRRAEITKALSLATATSRRLVIGSTKGAAPAPQPTPVKGNQRRSGRKPHRRRR